MVLQLLKLLLVEPDLTFDKNEKVTDVEGEVAKFNNAIEASKVELTKIRNNAEVQWVLIKLLF